MRKTVPEGSPRTRRTADDARTAILDATEKRLIASGPASIRIQDVAHDVGVSHPTVLHHFGSRERLVEAVITRRIHAMHEEVVGTLASAGSARVPAVELFERLFDAFGPGGHARVVAFLALEGRVPREEPQSLLPLAHATHASRLKRFDPDGPLPTFEDTHFTVLLAALALFGEAIVGTIFRGEPEGAPDMETSQRFRTWLANLVVDHLERGATKRA